MGKKTVRGHDIANRFVYSLNHPLCGWMIIAGWASGRFWTGLWEIVGHYGHNGYFQKFDRTMPKRARSNQSFLRKQLYN